MKLIRGPDGRFIFGRHILYDHHLHQDAIDYQPLSQILTPFLPHSDTFPLMSEQVLDL